MICSYRNIKLKKNYAMKEYRIRIFTNLSRTCLDIVSRVSEIEIVWKIMNINDFSSIMLMISYDSLNVRE